MFILSLSLGCRAKQASTTKDDETPVSGEDTHMTYFEANGYQLAGAEFWPYVGTAEFRYPEDVEWGFAAGTPAARSCAKRAHTRLKEFFNENWPEMQRVVELGATSSFYLWTDDYTQDELNRPRRRHRIWHWNSGEKDYTIGFWKWESVVTQQGECLIPQDAQVRTELQNVINILVAQPQ
jgi:hypothetical protein